MMTTTGFSLSYFSEKQIFPVNPVTVRQIDCFPDSRQQMLENSQFVDAKVQIFAKYGSAQWQKVGEYDVPRRLITK